MKRFKDGQQIRIVRNDHPATGETGQVVRLRRADDAAWVEMDRPLPMDLRSFPEGDSRANHMLLDPEDCEPFNGTANKTSPDGTPTGSSGE